MFKWKMTAAQGAAVEPALEQLSRDGWEVVTVNTALVETSQTVIKNLTARNLEVVAVIVARRPMTAEELAHAADKGKLLEAPDA